MNRQRERGAREHELEQREPHTRRESHEHRHSRSAGAPDPNASKKPLCGDCHGAHDIKKLTSDPVAKAAYQASAQTCSAIYGGNRYATSAGIAAYALRKGWASAGFVGLATGTDFPDALGGGPACGGNSGALLLTTPAKLSPEARAFIQKHDAELTGISLFGGTTVVKPAVEASVKSL